MIHTSRHVMATPHPTPALPLPPPPLSLSLIHKTSLSLHALGPTNCNQNRYSNGLRTGWRNPRNSTVSSSALARQADETQIELTGVGRGGWGSGDGEKEERGWWRRAQLSVSIRLLSLKLYLKASLRHHMAASTLHKATATLVAVTAPL